MNGKSVRAIGVAGILWNLVGVGNYLAHVGLVGAGDAASAGGAMPAVITAAFATAVFAGLAGSVALSLAKRWAAPLLWLSFVASVVNWAWVLGYSEAASVPLGVAVIVIALVLALASSRTPRATLR